MLELNSLVINGKSTAGLPYYCAVEELSPPVKAKKKDKLITLDYANGVMKQSVDAYDPITKVYRCYLYNTDKDDARNFKTFVSDEGWFTPWDEPDVKYYFEQSELEFEPLDMVGGYEVVVTFVCQPFALSEERTELVTDTITNNGTAPMYPLIKVTGATGTQTFLTIGEQTMYFKEIQDYIYIECRHGFQDAWSSGGRKVNHQIRGHFFEIPPGKHKVTKGTGINSIEITYRVGWR